MTTTSDIPAMFWLKQPLKLGGAMALLSLPIHALLTPEASHGLAALFLVLIAGVYVGFAVQDGRASVLAVEGMVALGFLIAAAVGLWLTPWAVPAAYITHGFWDIAHHRGIGAAPPRWYPPLCAVFDWTFAAGLSVIWFVMPS